MLFSKTKVVVGIEQILISPQHCYPINSNSVKCHASTAYHQLGAQVHGSCLSGQQGHRREEMKTYENIYEYLTKAPIHGVHQKLTKDLQQVSSYSFCGGIVPESSSQNVTVYM